MAVSSVATPPGTVRHVERYEIAIAAERADTSVEELRGLVELGILQPDADGRFSDGDIRRVGVVHSLVAASIPLDLLASALRSGELSFDFIDDPAYSLFASFSDETFEELSARTGVPLHLLVAMREATGSGVPDPASRVREDEMAILPAIEFQLAHGFRAITIERNLRVMGDSLRRIAETSGDTWRSEVMEPLLAAGYTTKQVGEASNEVSREWTPLDAQALLAVYRAQLVHTWTANIILGAESALAKAGLHDRLDRAPAMCFLDITGIHPPHPGTGRRRGCRSGNEPGEAGRAHLGQARRTTGQVARRRGHVLLQGPGPGGSGRPRDGRGRGRGRAAAGPCRSARRPRGLPGR